MFSGGSSATLSLNQMSYACPMLIALFRWVRVRDPEVLVVGDAKCTQLVLWNVKCGPLVKV